jgi:hypothetical protein
MSRPLEGEFNALMTEFIFNSTGSKVRLVRKADNLTAIYEPIV